MDSVQLRHYDYRLSVANLAAGQRVTVPLELESDSSFILRGRAIHYRSSSPQLAGQSALSAYMDRYTGPDGEYLSQSVTRFQTECPTYGAFGSPLPVRPPVIYPPGGVVMVDLYNSGNTDFVNLQVYFRGQKVFRPGALPCRIYPDPMTTLRFTYNSAAVGLGVSETRSNIVRNIAGDADFVLRALTMGAMNPTDGGPSQYREVFVQLRDSDGRAYSNLPVHIDTCFGACGALPAGGGSGANLPGAVQVGPFHPALLTPEIYVPHNDFLLYDLSRDDAYVGGLAACDIRLAFQGAKVYPL